MNKYCGIFLFLTCVILLGSCEKEKPKKTIPADRFKSISIPQRTSKTAEISYEIGKIYVKSPSQSIAEISDILVTGQSYLTVKYELIYMGRTGSNSININYVHYSEIYPDYVLSDEEKTLTFFIEDVGSTSTMIIGDPSEPILVIEFTLEGSLLYYRIVDDCVSE